MQVRSIKAEFSPSFGVYITDDCLIGKLNLKKKEKRKTRLSDWKTISLESNAELDLHTKELEKQRQCAVLRGLWKDVQNRSFYYLLEYLRLKIKRDEK